MSKLTNRKLKKLLRDACNSIETPNVRDKVKTYPIKQFGDNSEQAVKRRISRKSVWRAGFAVCCIAVISVTLGVTLPINSNGVKPAPPQVCSYSYVTIDINPSVTIRLDSDKNVVDITNNNYDGGVVVSGIDVKALQGQNVDAAIDAVLNSAAACGFIAYNDHISEKIRNAVKVVALDDDGENAVELMNSVVDEVKDYFSYRNIYALVAGDNASMDLNDEIMEKYGITYGKYSLIKDLYYQTKSVPIDKTQAQKDLDEFIRDNKNARVSSLYERIRVSVTDNFEKIYQCVYDVMIDINGYLDYISNIDINYNIDIDKFIENELRKMNFEELWTAKSKLFYSSVVIKIIDLQDAIFQAIEQVVSQTSREFIMFIDWIRSISSGS